MRDFKHICQIPEDELDDRHEFVISEKARPSDAGSQTYTAHNMSEVSVMVPEAVGNRDMVMQKRGGGIQELKETHRAADPLHFVLLHSRGSDGWSLDNIMEEPEEHHGTWEDYEAKRLTCNKF